MNDGPRLADERLDALERTVRALEHRILALEQGSSVNAQLSDSSVEPSASGELEQPPFFDPVALLTLVGRTLVVLGGAYLLRALTEAGVWPVAVGVIVAFLYATVWLGAAASWPRAPRSRPSASFHGATSLMIAIPVLWESVTRFHVAGAVAASAMLVAIAAAVLAVAVRTRLQNLAWLAVSAALPTERG